MSPAQPLHEHIDTTAQAGGQPHDLARPGQAGQPHHDPAETLGHSLHLFGHLADAIRVRKHPEGIVTYIIDRNVNYTNICVARCNFCAFYRPVGSSDGYVLGFDEIFQKIDETIAVGGNQLLLQGGHNPDLPIQWYEDLFRAVKARYPDLPDARLVPELVRDQIGLMVNDVLENTRANIAASGVETAADVRAAGRMLAGFSPELADAERDWKRFMYATLYHHPRQLAASAGAQRIVNDLFAAYHADPNLMASGWAERCNADEPDKSRHIADFIAGMTDRYALSRHQEIFGVTALPDEFVI